tara:strand:- start:387 stop:1220 length:834 start_codon:yes stop_codon:yes gene_type:complete
MNKLLLITVFFFFVGCESKTDPFKWIETLPKPWMLDQKEFEALLPDFQDRFPEYYQRLKALNLWRVGTPYRAFCLGEETGQDTDPLIRIDSSDCTVHILTTLAFAESFNWQSARDMMVDIHYKMDKNGMKVPTYHTRWHFTSDRILNHSKTIDITPIIAPSSEMEFIDIVLNEKNDGSEFLDLNWKNRETIGFIPIVNLKDEHLKNLPSVCGVAFVKRSYFQMGIVIAHEGFMIDNSNLIHASSEYRETVNIKLMDYLYKSGEPRFDGVMFYKITTN